MAKWTKFTIEYLDDGPDAFGRRTYFLHWTDEDTGLHRGQVFFMVPPQGLKEYQCPKQKKKASTPPKSAPSGSPKRGSGRARSAEA